MKGTETAGSVPITHTPITRRVEEACVKNAPAAQ